MLFGETRCRSCGGYLAFKLAKSYLSEDFVVDRVVVSICKTCGKKRKVKAFY